MNMKEYLSQAIWLDKRINCKIEQLNALKTLAMKVTTDTSREKIQSSYKSGNSSMENVVIKVIELQQEINSDIDKFVDLKREITSVINTLEDMNYQLLLELRYINCKPWHEIAFIIGYEERTVYRMHGRALKKLEKIKSVSKSQ